MFRIAFFVRDKHLAEVLTGLDGKVFNLEVAPAKIEGDTPEPAPKKQHRTGKNYDDLKAAPAINKMNRAAWSAMDVAKAAPDLSRTAIYKALQTGIAEGRIVSLGKGQFRHNR